MQQMHRSSGILLHPTSLPGPHGIGDLGAGAHRFVDVLADMGQGVWQILPLGHTSYGNSPYMCLTAFGGNPHLISPELLVEGGLLDADDVARPPDLPSGRVDYARATQHKMPLLEKAFRRFRGNGARHEDAFYAFCDQQAFWLEDYALFAALKDAHDGVQWTRWEEGARLHDPDALVRWRNELADGILFWKFLQFEFFQQWSRLRAHCRDRGVLVVGDIPIYVAGDSAEVWSHRDLFHLDDRGEPVVVAGVPPDYFSQTGQRWGNPIYRWEEMARCGYRWWIDRFRTNFSMVDTVRLDHFRGFEAYWEIPATAATAVDGRWVKGPGVDLFDAVRHDLGDVQMIAEDLGVITAEVDAMRDELGFPGMRILQMAFGTDSKASEYRPHHHVESSAVYTATHDHNTTVGWFTAEPGTQTTQSPAEIERERRHALRYIGSDGREIHWDFVRMALRSVARLAVFPLQDVLGQGSESRMNLPGTPTGNWEWRFTFDMLTDEIRSRLREWTELYERIPSFRPPRPR